jgi:hypothetical protein
MNTKTALKIMYELIIYNEELARDEDFSECWKAYEHLNFISPEVQVITSDQNKKQRSPRK